MVQNTCFYILTTLRLVVHLHGIAEELIARVFHCSCICCTLGLRLHTRAIRSVTHCFHLIDLLRNLDAQLGDRLLPMP